jgi:AraC-like DNA-binding protein
MHAKVIVDTAARENDRQSELAARVGALTRNEGMNETAIPAVAIMRASSTTQPLPALYEPCLCIVVQGRKRAVLEDESFTYDPLNYLVVPVTLPMFGQIVDATPEHPYLCLRIGIDPSVVGDLVLQMRSSATAVAPSARALFVARASEPMLDAVLRLVCLLDEPQDTQVLAPLVLREVYYRALVGELGHRLRELCYSGSQLQRIARAIDTIKTRFAEPLRVEDLAAVAHMSSSSLHHHFRAITSMSPLQFQKQLRLHEARRLMLAEGVDAAAAAYRVGYESASQFSREYRRLFGAPPRRAIEALRA